MVVDVVSVKKGQVINMKKIIALLLILALIMVGAACGDTSNPETTNSSAPSQNQNQNQGTEQSGGNSTGGNSSGGNSTSGNSTAGNDSATSGDSVLRNDTAPREFSFRIYNESNYDIYSVHMGPLNGAAEDDVDIIDYILVSGDDVLVSGFVPGHLSSVTEWTLYITDVDDDTSSSYDIFNPFSLIYVDVIWDYDSAGYRCQFNYGGGNSNDYDVVDLSYRFTIYNESDYTIYSIHMGPSGGASTDDVDILQSTLAAGAQVEISGTVSAGSSSEWTLYVTDVDGDTSVSYEVFNLFDLSYVDVVWDSGVGGYRCEFVY